MHRFSPASRETTPVNICGLRQAWIQKTQTVKMKNGNWLVTHTGGQKQHGISSTEVFSRAI